MADEGLATTVISKAASEAVAMASFSSQTPPSIGRLTGIFKLQSG